MIKNPPASAGNMGLIPDPGRSHMPLGKYACVPVLKPVHLEPGLHHSEKPTQLNKE